MSAQRVIAEPARSVPVIADVDVLVLGGGPAGIAAAVTAARLGARTLLVERYGFLGGMGTAALVTNFCGLFAEIGGRVETVVHGIADEIVDGIRALGGLNVPQSHGPTTVLSYDVSAYKCVADRLMKDAGVTLRLHTLAVGAIMDGARIQALLVESKSGRQAICARIYIDASGDADLAAWSGAPFEKGRADGYLAYPTMMFKLGGVDTARAEAEGRERLRDEAQHARARGDHGFLRASPIASPQAHAGEWRMNMTQVNLDGGPVDGTDVEQLTRAELIGREQVLSAARFLRERIPGFANSYVLEIAPQLGIRETRRIVGRTILSAEDIVAGRRFDDAIGCAGWPMEKHVLGTIEWVFVGGRGDYQLPYGSLLPQAVDNLLVAGRCFSATQDAQASARVSGPCFVMGQGAGAAAALAIEGRLTPADVPVAHLQATLRTLGVHLG